MVKKYIIPLISFCILIYASCSKDESSNQIPKIHDSIEIDIDEDGTADYTIKYSGIDIEPLSPSGGIYGIGGRLQPYGKNEILRHKEEEYLFLRDLEEIEENVAEPLKWRNTFSSTIVTIATINAEGEWPNKWEINSATEHSTYFLGLKLVTDFEIQLAWVEIDINTTNGLISIVDKGIL